MIQPALRRAIDSAKMASCMNSLKQFSMALDMYTVDNQGYYPGHHTVTGTVYTWEGQITVVWPTRIREYMGKTIEPYTCPMADERATWTKQFGSGLPARYGYDADEIRLTNRSFFSYGYNDWGVREFNNPHLGLGGHIGQGINGEQLQSRLYSPSSMIALGDSRTNGTWDTCIDPVDGGREYPSVRHFNGTVLAFADAHVKWMDHFDLMDDLSIWNATGESHNARHNHNAYCQEPDAFR